MNHAFVFPTHSFVNVSSCDGLLLYVCISCTCTCVLLVYCSFVDVKRNFISTFDRIAILYYILAWRKPRCSVFLSFFLSESLKVAHKYPMSEVAQTGIFSYVE